MLQFILQVVFQFRSILHL